MDLVVQQREITGKKVKTLRREGLVPAELYGHGLKNEHLAVPVKEFNKVFKEAGSNTVVYLMIGKEKHPALIHEVERNYVSDQIMHVDFYQVRMDEKLKAKVPLEFLGEAPAVKEFGGILNKAMSEIEVEALPADLPHRLSVDLSGLRELNQSIYVRDIKLPKGVQVSVGPETVIATITEPLPEEEVKVEEAPVDLNAIKSETEEKTAERAAAKEVKGTDKKETPKK